MPKFSNPEINKESWRESKRRKEKGIKSKPGDIKKEWSTQLNKAKNLTKNLSRGANLLGAGLALGEIVSDGEIRSSHVLNASVLALSAVPVVGWVFGGAYFIADLTTIAITKKSIGQHVDKAVGEPLMLSLIHI